MIHDLPRAQGGGVGRRARGGEGKRCFAARMLDYAATQDRTSFNMLLTIQPRGLKSMSSKSVLRAALLGASLFATSAVGGCASAYYGAMEQFGIEKSRPQHRKCMILTGPPGAGKGRQRIWRGVHEEGW